MALRVILKQSEHRHIEGITTAAGIWLTATVGIVTGMGRLGLGITGAILALVILTVVGQIERKFIPERSEKS